nr:hypothetical protein [Silicimonas algicola]
MNRSLRPRVSRPDRHRDTSGRPAARPCRESPRNAASSVSKDEGVAVPHHTLDDQLYAEVSGKIENVGEDHAGLCPLLDVVDEGRCDLDPVDSALSEV